MKRGRKLFPRSSFLENRCERPFGEDVQHAVSKYGRGNHARIHLVFREKLFRFGELKNVDVSRIRGNINLPIDDEWVTVPGGFQNVYPIRFASSFYRQ